ncbi:MAG: alpha/beta hydrolase [Bacteroidetes bacterium]|nr:MAG: alpha/beta hydrolase [Bacteroidota bacterium]
MPCDFRLPEAGSKVPVVVFSHGLKGFKDWGHFNLLAGALCRAGLAVLKFSFSHSGTTPDHPEDFVDLEAFGMNTFSKELDDLGIVLDWLHRDHDQRSRIDPEKIYLIGHSRGGGISILKAAEDPRVKKIVTWAAVSDFEPRVNPPDLESWREAGVSWTLNTRTGQNMPMYYSLREDFYANKNRLDIPAAAARIRVPFLIIHGTADTSVNFREAEKLKSCNPAAELLAIENADHTFGGKHPFTSDELPEHSKRLIMETAEYLL